MFDAALHQKEDDELRITTPGDNCLDFSIGGNSITLYKKESQTLADLLDEIADSLWALRLEADPELQESIARHGSEEEFIIDQLERELNF